MSRGCWKSLNWTKVGLKAEMALRAYLNMESLNWTKVGLKDVPLPLVRRVRRKFELD